MKVTSSGGIRLAGALATLVLLAGCAPAYHNYSDCRVRCQYCPPAPLPYVHYDQCVCHACIARRHLAADAGTDEAIVEVKDLREESRSAPGSVGREQETP